MSNYLTERQGLRFNLISLANHDVEKAKEMYDFIMDYGEAESYRLPLIEVGAEEDGVYICYEDGKHEVFNGANSTEKVSHIGLKVGKHKIGISLNSLGEQKLPSTNTNHDHYFDREVDALGDMNGKENTDRFRDGLDFDIDDDEWIPSLGELVLIAQHMNKLNEALAYVGGDELALVRHWSSTESGSLVAWFVNFSYGGVNGYGKYNSYVVRPVCAF